MTERRQLGDFGERVAAAHLESQGYRILETNFRVREGEIDIVAERDGVVAFVEVKTRRSDAMGGAIEALKSAMVDWHRLTWCCEAHKDECANRYRSVVYGSARLAA